MTSMGQRTQNMCLHMNNMPAQARAEMSEQAPVCLKSDRLRGKGDSNCCHISYVPAQRFPGSRTKETTGDPPRQVTPSISTTGESWKPGLKSCCTQTAAPPASVCSTINATPSPTRSSGPGPEWGQGVALTLALAYGEHPTNRELFLCVLSFHLQNSSSEASSKAAHCSLWNVPV